MSSSETPQIIKVDATLPTAPLRPIINWADIDLPRVDFSSRKLLVLYGSQTGSAQALARRVGREARR